MVAGEVFNIICSPLRNAIFTSYSFTLMQTYNNKQKEQFVQNRSIKHLTQ